MRQFANEQPERADYTITASSIDKETDKAIQITAPNGTRLWLPKSQIEIQPQLDGKSIDIIIPAWLADEKDLEGCGF